MSTPDDAIGERAARALRALVETYAFDVADALSVVRALPTSEDGDDLEDLKRCVDRLLDERGCVDNGGPALGMTRTCAHGARVDARRAREAATRATRSARTAAQGGKFPKRIAWFFRNDVNACTFFREVFSCGLVWRVVSYGSYSRDGASRATFPATQTTTMETSPASLKPAV